MTAWFRPILKCILEAAAGILSAANFRTHHQMIIFNLAHGIIIGSAVWITSIFVSTPGSRFVDKKSSTAFCSRDWLLCRKEYNSLFLTEPQSEEGAGAGSVSINRIKLKSSGHNIDIDTTPYRNQRARLLEELQYLVIPTQRLQLNIAARLAFDKTIVSGASGGYLLAF